MSRTVLVLLTITFLSCDSSDKTEKTQLADLNLIIESRIKIDSLWISDIEQTQSRYIPYSDTIQIDFDNEMNDLYNIDLYTKEGRKSSQYWLNGTDVIIKGRLDKYLEIDTVINSDLYYKSISFEKEFRDLLKESSDSSKIDRFLLDNIQANISTPLSFAMAGPYIHRNQNNKDKISELFEILSPQEDRLKKHFISVHSKIEGILKVDSLNLTDYRFANIDNTIDSLKIKEDNTLLIDLWFVNCPPCVKDHKTIANKQEILKTNKVKLVGISTDRNHLYWRDYIEKNKYDWENFREVDSLERITKNLAIWSFPTYLHLDSNGKLLGRYGSFDDFEKNTFK